MSHDLFSLDGQVELRGLLGTGGMGEVHRGWDRRLERPVAVKFVFSRDVRDTERLLLEARLQARVEHPNVVQVHEVGSLGDRPCIVMQLVEGRSLAQLGPELSVPDRVELMRQAGLGLHAAHAQGLVHRDVKPSNVLVEQGPGGARHALLTDFGLARGDEPGLTRSGLPAGTLDYMSPEQLLAPGPVDFRSDIYALGATLYAVLAGHPPFRRRAPSGSAGDSERDGFTLQRILEEEPEPLVRAAPGVSRELGVIVGRAMERQPADRYASAEAFSDDLGRLQRGEPIQARPLGWPEQAIRWTRRNRGLTRALAVAVLALLLAGGWTLWTRRQADRAALEAARLGALTELMEAELRMEHLSPPHDLRPALTRIRAEADRLRPLAATGDGPANLALGKALQLGGDLEGARTAYETAWQAGFRSPRGAEGLGTVLAELYRRQFERARETLAPEPRAARQAMLAAELREPAQQYLTLSDSAGWRGELLQASLAILQRDFPEVRKHAEAALAFDPGRYEATVLAGQASLEEGRQLGNEQKLDESGAALDRASETIERAALFGRSDPTVASVRVQIQSIRATNQTVRGRSPDAELKAMMTALDQGLLLDPDDPSLTALRGGALMQRSMFLFMSDLSQVLPTVQQAAAAFRRATELGANDSKTLCNLGRALYYEATQLNHKGESAIAVVQEGLDAVDRAEKIAPQDPEVFFVRTLLHRTEGDALKRDGKSPAPAFQACIESGERALAMGAARATLLRPLIGEAQTLLAQQTWLEGGDPRPGLAKARKILAEAVAALPGQPAAVGQLAFAADTEADIRWSLGEDARASIADAVAKLDEVLAKNAGLLPLQALKGELLVGESVRRAEVGEDPTPVLAEGQQAMDKAAPGMTDDEQFQLARALALLAEARWNASQGRDPTALLARAERGFDSVRTATSMATAQEFLGLCALERAQRLARTHHPTAEVARQGLVHTEASLKADARDPGVWILQGRLQLMAGNRAAAQQDLQRAWSINPLSRLGRASKAAEAELQSH